LHDGQVKQLEKSILDQRKQLIGRTFQELKFDYFMKHIRSDAMEDQERRFLEEKSHLFKDLDDQKAAFREVALKEAR